MEQIIEQGSEAWLQLRLGKFTASEIHRLMGDCKRDMTEDELKAFKEKNPKSTAKQCVDPHLLSKGAMTYIMEVASERETGKPAKPFFENDAMRWGKEHEPSAKQLYSLAHDVEVLDAPFITYKEYAGASPDGFIGLIGGIEVKCPVSPAIHMAYRTLTNYGDLKENYADHFWQCIMGLKSTNRTFWKFMSYHPHYEPVKQLKIINIPRLEDELELLEIKLTAAEKACQFLVKMK